MTYRKMLHHILAPFVILLMPFALLHLLFKVAAAFVEEHVMGSIDD